MGARVLVVSLVPREVLARAVGELRERDPKAEVTALVGTAEAVAAGAGSGADEVLRWHGVGGGGLPARIRGRGFDRLLVVHGGDQYASRAYWKAVALTLASRAREKGFWEESSGRERGLAEAVMAGGGGAAIQLVQEAYVAGMGTLVLVPMLIGVAVTDLGEALLGRRAAGGPARRGKNRD
jgi:hypothetical protein